MDYLEKRIKDYDRVLFDNAGVKKRTVGVGKIEMDYAVSSGVTGPNLRASGMRADLRKDDPYLVYDRLEFEVPVLKGGDIYSRILQRRLEFGESIKIIRQVLEMMPKGKFFEKPPSPIEWKVREGEVFERVESSKGEFGYYVVSDGGTRPYRVFVRGPSYTHGIKVVSEKSAGLRIADAPAFFSSLDVCPPDIER